jgi:hypothetical protein
VIRVWVAVGGGATRFRTEVRGESVERAVRLALANYPGCERRIIFPIYPQVFFCEEPVPAEGAVPRRHGTRDGGRSVRVSDMGRWILGVKADGLAAKGQAENHTAGIF